MILPDVNVLVYGFHADEPRHPTTRAWLGDVLSAPGQRLGLTESTVTGFVRIVTNPRIYDDPAPTRSANAYVRSLVDTGATSWLQPNRATWEAFQRLCHGDRLLRADLIPDAWLAALALAHGARIASADRGFGRFPGIEHFDPTG